MARAALVLAAVGSALAFLTAKFCELQGWEPPKAAYFYLLVPAVLLGAWCWAGRASAARSLPVLAALGVAWVGLLYGAETESRRGLLIAIQLTSVVMLAALIVDQRARGFSSRVYLWLMAFALVLTVAWEYQTQLGSLAGVYLRFGQLTLADRRTYTVNPNQAGCYFAIAAVMAFIVYLEKGELAWRTGRPVRRGRVPYLVLAVLFSLACLATGSRGASAAWLVGMAMLVWRGTRTQAFSKVRDWVMFAAAAVLLGLFASVSSDDTPWQKLIERWTSGPTNSVASVGSRLSIWENALAAWSSDVPTIVVGAGTGMADELIGEADDGALADGYGNSIRSAHNAYIEWLVSYGLVGAAPAVWLVVWGVRRARRLDVRDGSVDRLALLATMMVLCLTGSAYRHPGWLIPGAIALAMLDPACSAKAAVGRREAAAAERLETAPAALLRPIPSRT